jgi:hypothetical protein
MPTCWSVWDEHLLVVLIANLWYPTIRTGGLNPLGALHVGKAVCLHPCTVEMGLSVSGSAECNEAAEDRLA